MREQVIASPGARRAATSPRGFVQRPSRRQGAGGGRVQLRTLLRYAPAVFKYVMILATVIALVIAYRAAASASLFQLRAIDVTGATRVSSEEVSAVTRRAVARTGVWRADLSAISAELQRLPGVRRAIVTRVLPDRLRVRVIERVPVAVVRTSAGHFVWVDEEGVALGEMKSADHMPAFFIRGWSDDEVEDPRKENAQRVQRYLELTRAWDPVGLSERISEVNLIDIRDVRAQLAGDDSQIEVRLGSQDFGERLKDALEVLDSQKQGPRAALITYIDLTQGRRAVIGFSTGSKLSTARDGSEEISRNNAAASATVTTQPVAETTAAGNANPVQVADKDHKPAPDKKPKPAQRSRH